MSFDSYLRRQQEQQLLGEKVGGLKEANVIKQAEIWEKVGPADYEIYDPDTIKINGEPLRLVGSMPGIAVSAYEREPSPEQLLPGSGYIPTYNDPLNPNFGYHRDRYAERYNVNSEDVTKEDLYRAERDQRRRLEGKIGGGPIEVLRTGEEGKYGRGLARVRTSEGEEIGDWLATSEESASYNAPFNATQRYKDLMSGKTQKQAEAEEGRSAMRAIGDIALSGAKGINELAELARYGADVATGDLGQEWFNEEREKIAKTSSWLESLKSENAQQRRKVRDDKHRLWSEDRDYRVQKRLDNGQSLEVAELADVKDSFLHWGSALLDDPGLLVDDLAESVGPGGVVIGAAKAGVWLAVKGRIRKLVKAAGKPGSKLSLGSDVVQKELARVGFGGGKAGAVVGTGVVGGAQVGSEVQKEIQDLDLDYLRENSEKFRAYEAAGSTPEEARERLADYASVVAGVTGALVSAGVAVVSGGAGLEAGLASQGVKGLTGSALKHSAKQVLEEGLQEGGQEVAGNVGLQEADPGQRLLEGVGEASVGGAVLGGLGGGAVTAPSVLKKADYRPGEAVVAGSQVEEIAKAKVVGGPVSAVEVEVGVDPVSGVEQGVEVEVGVDPAIANPAQLNQTEQDLTDAMVGLEEADKVPLQRKLQVGRESIYGPEVKALVAESVDRELTKDEQSVLYLGIESGSFGDTELKAVKNLPDNISTLLIEVSKQPINPLTSPEFGFTDSNGELGLAGRIAGVRDAIANTISGRQEHSDLKGLVQDVRDYVVKIQPNLDTEQEAYALEAVDNLERQVDVYLNAPTTITSPVQKGSFQAFLAQEQDQDQIQEEEPKKDIYQTIVSPINQAVETAITKAGGDKLVKGARKWLDKTTDNVSGLQNLQHELTGLGSQETDLRKLRMSLDTNITDKQRIVSRDIESQIHSNFKKDLLESENLALNEVMLRTDLSSLLADNDIDTLIDLVKSSEVRKQTIQDIENQLTKDHPVNAGEYIEQSKSLANLIVKSEVLGNVGLVMTNAHDIANLYSKPGTKPTGDLKKAELLIDQLTTLRALEIVPEEQINSLQRILDTEQAGLSNLLALHNAFKKLALEKNFQGSKTGMFKGYTREQFNPNIAYEFAPLDKETQSRLGALGYSKPIPIKRDSLVSRILGKQNKDTDIGFYTSNLNTERTRGSLVSGIDMQIKGSDLFSDPAVNVLEGKKVIDTLTREMQNQPGVSQLIPILNQQNRSIAGFRRIMSDSLKQEVLQRKDLATENLGRMFAHTRTKPEAVKNHRQVIDYLKRYWLTNRNTDTKFRYIGFDAKDIASKEAFQALPEGIRKLSKPAFGRNGMYVSDEFYNVILGFKEISLSKGVQSFSAGVNELFKNNKHAKVPRFVLESINIADRTWKEVIQQARVKSSLALPIVMLGNVVSNQLVLLADGISPIYVAKQTRKLLPSLVKLNKQLSEAGRLDTDILSLQEQNKPVSALQKRKEVLQKEIEKNPLHVLRQKGLLQAAPTELIPGQEKGSNHLLLNNLIRKPQQFLKEKLGRPAALPLKALEEAYAGPGTKIFDLILQANAIPDQLGRAIKYFHDIENNVPKDKAINDAMDLFVYYPEESTSTLTAANEYGLIMFSRYFLRIQRAMTKLLGKKAGTALSIAWLDQTLLEDTWLGSVTPADYLGNIDNFVAKTNLDRLFGSEGGFEGSLERSGKFPVYESGKWLLDYLK